MSVATQSSAVLYVSKVHPHRTLFPTSEIPLGFSLTSVVRSYNLSHKRRRFFQLSTGRVVMRQEQSCSRTPNLTCMEIEPVVQWLLIRPPYSISSLLLQIESVFFQLFFSTLRRAAAAAWQFYMAQDLSIANGARPECNQQDERENWGRRRGGGGRSDAAAGRTFCVDVQPIEEFKVIRIGEEDGVYSGTNVFLLTLHTIRLYTCDEGL